MSWKLELREKATGKWVERSFRFATREEVTDGTTHDAGWAHEVYCADYDALFDDYRAVESDDPVNATWDAELQMLEVKLFPCSYQRD